MNREKGIITGETTVYQAVTEHPELKKVLKEISSNYKKLENPVVFNTAARITTMKSAARIGKVYVNDLLMRLNEAIGKKREFEAYMEKMLPVMQKEFMEKMAAGKKTGKTPEWMDKRTEFSVIDARITEEPFSLIMKKASETAPGAGFVLIQKFEPAPVIDNLKNKGFEANTEKISDKEYRVYFFRKEKENEEHKQ